MNMKKFKKALFSIDDKLVGTKFDFCKNLKWFLIAPILICLVGLIVFCCVGFKLGIDFTGGSVMTVYVDNTGEYTYDDSKYDLNKNRGEIERIVISVLEKHGLSVSTFQDTTMSEEHKLVPKGSALIIKYQNNNDLTSSEIEDVNHEIRLEMLKAFKYVEQNATLDELEGKYVEVASLVEEGGITTAAASSELLMKSFIALLVAVVLILIYVAIRFEITSGLAAILALFHDVLVTASIMIICRVQVNVAFIAALITILGYSINNTIIIFDRMRDSLKMARQSDKKIVNTEIANMAVKNTMMRSILTTITTFIMIFLITVIGVADIREFAFPIMIGIMAGFYSSVFITPGLWSIAYRPKKKKSIDMGGNKTKVKSNKKDMEIVEIENNQVNEKEEV